MNRASMLVLLGAGSILGLLVNACTNDGGASVTPGACDSIIEACHTKDDGSDEFINGCHSTAHEGTDADCSPNLQACIDACNAAPDVATGGYETGSTEESGHAHESSGATGHDSSGGSGGHGTTTSDHTTSGTTAADDSSQASCDELGTICHDVADELGMMCHDIGHAGDEAACAEVWVECIAHCTA